jgi:hypothetical protein
MDDIQVQVRRYTPHIGWVSFSLVFNIMNTIVYSTLYPKVLESIAPADKYMSAFSTINFVTTLLSAGMNDHVLASPNHTNRTNHHLDRLA